MVDMQVHLAGTADGISIVHAACQAAGVPLDRAIQAIRFAELQHREAVRQAEEIESAVLKGTSQTFQFGNLSIPTEHIGRVIGSGGSNVKHIQDRTGSKIIGLEDGTFHVFAPSEHAVREALRMVQDSLPPVVKEGERFLAKVVSIKDFGAFVLLPNKAEALLHISQLAHERVRDVSDILKVGDEVEVVVLGSDQRGNIRVSRKAALETAPCSGAASTS
uniref:Polyribonucleotide nucleotidyltransferase n=1 Tax=Tetraselmis sp. GSL018 TaxID=582737 RepID=A0A061SG02_9CHLO